MRCQIQADNTGLQGCPQKWFIIFNLRCLLFPCFPLFLTFDGKMQKRWFRVGNGMWSTRLLVKIHNKTCWGIAEQICCWASPNTITKIFNCYFGYILHKKWGLLVFRVIFRKRTTQMSQYFILIQFEGSCWIVWVWNREFFVVNLINIGLGRASFLGLQPISGASFLGLKPITEYYKTRTFGAA